MKKPIPPCPFPVKRVAYRLDLADNVREVLVVEETDKSYIRARYGWGDRWEQGRKFKDANPIYDTWGEAKAEAIRRAEIELTSAEKRVERAKDALAKAQAIVGPHKEGEP